MRFFVEGSPVPNARARKGKNGFYTPDSTRAWKEIVARRFKEAHPGHEPFGPNVCVSLVIEVVCPGKGPRSRIRGDFDNFAKGVSDALNGLAWHDDIQVVKAEIEKRRVRGQEEPGVWVHIEAIQ